MTKMKRPNNIGPKLFKEMLKASDSTEFSGFIVTTLNASDFDALINDVAFKANDIGNDTVAFHNATEPMIKLLSNTPEVTYIEMSEQL